MVYNHVGSTSIYTTENGDDIEEIQEAGHNHVGYINICTTENEDNLEELNMEDGHEDYGTPSISTGLEKKIQRKIINIFLPIIFNICFGSSKEPSH